MFGLTYLQKGVGFVATIATIIGYVTIKDRKETLAEKPSFRLINPSKFDIGKVIKRKTDQINQNISQNNDANHWKNTSVTDWFKAINNMPQCTLFAFDIESFYSSISLDL